MGSSRKRPHPPDGRVSGNSLGRRSQKTIEIQAGVGLNLKRVFFGDHFQPNVTPNF